MAFNRKKSTSDSKVHGIARVISKRGFCSRSKAEILVKEGCVTLRGKTVYNPETPTKEDDEIFVNGKKIEVVQKLYFLLNKPKGIVTTANDEKGRKTVMDLFRLQYEKLYPGKKVPHVAPVGRLDAASEGLLLLSNDTQWANNILEPQKKHLKIYHVQADGKPTPEDLKSMEKGFIVPPRVFGEKEEFMHAVSAQILREGEKNCWLEIRLNEGKNREIRRMLAALGFQVLRLVRIQIDDFKLGDLKPGEIKPLLL